MNAGGVIGGFRRLCLAQPGRMGFPEADDARILEVTKTMLDEGSAREVTLFTARAATLQAAEGAGIDLHPHASRLRWHFGDAEASLEARLQAAASLLKQGELDAVLAGNRATTAQVIRTGIKTLGLANGIKTVSGAFIMNREGQPGQEDSCYLFADSGVVIEPTALQLADIASEAAQLWRILFPPHPPKVAFLSFSTKGSAEHASLHRLREGLALFQARYPDVEADGELQFDAAFDPKIRAAKAPQSRLQGRANILIFPDLGAGNIGYKLAQRLGGFEAYGPILLGLAKSFSDLSRGSTVADILSSAYIGLLRAHNQP